MSIHFWLSAIITSSLLLIIKTSSKIKHPFRLRQSHLSSKHWSSSIIKCSLPPLPLLLSYISPSNLQSFWKYTLNYSLEAFNLVFGQILKEFDKRKPIMSPKEWFLHDNQIKAIVRDVEKFNFSPLSIIRAMPFCLPFEARIHILKNLISF